MLTYHLTVFPLAACARKKLTKLGDLSSGREKKMQMVDIV
jgi:hypothetical protein